MKGKVILDVGCSHGFVAQHLRLLEAEAFGLDVDLKALKEGPVKKYCIHGDALHLPMKNEGLDAIIAFELMEHLTDPNKALTAFWKCLKKDGVLLLTTPTPKSSKAYNIPEHVAIKSRDEWIQALKHRGFNVKIVTNRYPIHIPHAPEKLNSILGRLLGFWKKHFDVTSSKLMAIRK